MNRTTKIIIVLAAVLLVIALYIYPDSISVTMPPWDYCGFHETRGGTALDCIAFDVTPFMIK